MDTTIKIDYKAICKGIIDDTKYLYDLSDKDVENLPMDLKTILEWQEKIQDDDLIKHLQNDDLDYVVEILKQRR